MTAGSPPASDNDSRGNSAGGSGCGDTDSFIDHYVVLGIDPATISADVETTTVIIRKAFLKLSKKYHPDKHPHLETEQEKTQIHELFCRIKTAYDVLSCPTQKLQYDLQRKAYLLRKFHEAKRRSEHRASQRQQRQQRQQQDRNYWKQSTNKTSTKTAAGRGYHHRDNFDFDNDVLPRQRHHKDQGQDQTWKKQENEEEEEDERRHRRRRRRQQQQQQQQEREERRKRQEEQDEERRRRQRQQEWQQQQQQQQRQYQQRSGSSPHYSSYSSSSSSSTCSSTDYQNTFGKTRTGEDCKRCIQQGCYCWQHAYQDPNSKDEDHQRRRTRSKKMNRHGSSGRSSRSGYSSEERARFTKFGLRKDGQ
eukprot:CAMPEP_0113502336 /NCGR_PEP_ID=MMETSP0014_2-20120614/33488_1 /TAXON_ID=2857 /ORGANISM="Nitzschia sp." /LENGTH=362 /DNA_ID=CAMNT_0000397093 /DNA_START=720 /DNA_END=1805 /DNA_ORIENTATION=+ /assembly_acc=CAM_ASM_000159